MIGLLARDEKVPVRDQPDTARESSVAPPSPATTAPAVTVGLMQFEDLAHRQRQVAQVGIV
jgi:hypothetical protein